MVRTQIQLTEEQARALKRIAVSQRMSIAELVRRAVNAMIKSNTAADVEERHRRAAEIVGRFGSGKRDISKKHDLYLTEAYRK